MNTRTHDAHINVPFPLIVSLGAEIYFLLRSTRIGDHEAPCHMLRVWHAALLAVQPLLAYALGEP